MKHLIGHKVEDFKVQAYHQGDFKEVTLQDTKGHWSIFFFYPADFTFVCPTELGELADNYAKFQEIGCEVYSKKKTVKFILYQLILTSHIKLGQTTPKQSEKFNFLC